MSPIVIHVEIPALDRWCGLIEAGFAHAIPEAPNVECISKTVPEAVSAPAQAPVAPAAAVPAPEPQPAAAPEVPKSSAVTLDVIQRAAAQLRDEGKLKALTDMFPEFGINKLSDLAGEKLPAFADRLRKLGAKL